MASDPSTSLLAIDPAALYSLKSKAGSSPNQSLRQASQQFEGFLMNFLLKSMRDTVPKSDATNSMASSTYTAMLDQQYAMKMSEGKGMGIADLLVRQLEPKLPKESSGQSTASSVTSPKPSTKGRHQSSAPAEFKAKMVDFAAAASQTTGVPTNFLLAQAGLESGWGKHQPKLANGDPSFNLFGIKAGAHWKGPTTQAVTTEVIGGVPTKVVQSFRVYGSYEEAFRDYASTLISHSRYNQALTADSAAGFAHALQKAGYATDPFYAKKIQSVIQRLETPVA